MRPNAHSLTYHPRRLQKQSIQQDAELIKQIPKQIVHRGTVSAETSRDGLDMQALYGFSTSVHRENDDSDAEQDELSSSHAGFDFVLPKGGESTEIDPVQSGLRQEVNPSVSELTNTPNPNIPAPVYQQLDALRNKVNYQQTEIDALRQCVEQLSEGKVNKMNCRMQKLYENYYVLEKQIGEIQTYSLRQIELQIRQIIEVMRKLQK